MITTLKSLQDKFINDPDFKTQFEFDANETLGDNILGLGSNLLDIYYRALAKFLKNGHKRYPIYARVPFNEETFKIDTEARVVTVPKIFAQNGVGVVGDHLAEFLWFQVPRFYDMTDLMTCNIDITWRNTNRSGVDEEVYNTPPFAKYCDGETLYFGWYISKNAALVAGTLEFSIRFYSVATDENDVTQTQFSLYLQPAKLVIKPGMTIGTTVRLDDNFDQIVRNRAIYSEIVNSLDAAEPILRPTLTQGKYDLDVETNTITFTVGAISPDNAGLTLFVDETTGDLKARNEANEVVTPNAQIVYQWYWNNNLVGEHGEGVDFDPAKLEATPNVQIVTAADGSSSTLTTNVPGKYRVYVGNKIINPEVSNYNGIRYVQTETVTLEEATQIKLKETPVIPPHIYVNAGEPAKVDFDIDFASANGRVDYCWYKNDTPMSDNIVVTEENDLSRVLTERGKYYAKARNVKNLMITEAITPSVEAHEWPRLLTTSDIMLSIDENNAKKINVHINGAYTDSEYRYRLSLAPVGAQTFTNISLPEPFVIGADASFDLSELVPSAAAGLYSVTVFVAEVVCHGINGYEQYYRDEHNQIVEGANIIQVTI